LEDLSEAKRGTRKGNQVDFMPSIEEALEFMKANDMRWVDLQFVNMDGQIQHRTVAAKSITEDSFSNGVESDLGAIFGHTSGLSLVPDSDTFARIPWEPNTMRVISNIVSTQEKERFVKDSRYSAERVNINAKAMGISDILMGSELEFYIFDNVTGDKLSPERGPNFLIDTREASWNPSPFWNSKNGAYMGQPHDTLYAARVQMSEIMEDHFRYGVEGHVHGRSANGQQKFTLREYNVKMAADALVTMKYVARNFAFIANNLATFMPLPVLGDKGSALNITQKLRKGASNLFYDEKGDYGLSQTALYYIGGLLEHAEALSIFTASTTNSYRKLRADPRYVAWSASAANALVRVPSGKNEGLSVSYAGADPASNPYLAYAAVAAAGLDGIKNKTDPGKPVNEDISSMDSKRMKELKIRALPASIMEAISALENDNKFLKGFISAELLAEYLEQRLAEHKENEKRVTPYELDRYFNR
jgi:glutamine synthetase